MKAMVVDADTLSALRVSDDLIDAGFNIVGPARSSGEALVLAYAHSPDIVVTGIDLEASGAGARLAETIERDLDVPTVVRDGSLRSAELIQTQALLELARHWRRRKA